MHVYYKFNAFGQCIMWKPNRLKSKHAVYSLRCIPELFVSQTPVLNDVRDITLAQTIRNGLVALISYEHMVCRIAPTLIFI